MANLTISIEDEVLKKARMRALSEGTSVKRLVTRLSGTFYGGEFTTTGRRRSDTRRFGKGGESARGGKLDA